MRNDRRAMEGVAANFWSRVTPAGDNGCWLWEGPLVQGPNHGYGHVWYDGYLRPAHRVAYELEVGPIPPGLVIDHLCRVRHCVNPSHMEPVTHRENILRGEGVAARKAAQTHCKRGHPLSGDNLIVRKDGRACRACMKMQQQEWYEREKAKRAT